METVKHEINQTSSSNTTNSNSANLSNTKGGKKGTKVELKPKVVEEVQKPVVHVSSTAPVQNSAV